METVIESPSKNFLQRREEMNIMKRIGAFSSKGQLVIPKEMREQMGFKEGTYVMLTCDGESILIQRMPEISEEEYLAAKKRCEDWAKSTGLTEEEFVEETKEKPKGTQNGSKSGS